MSSLTFLLFLDIKILFTLSELVPNIIRVPNIMQKRHYGYYDMGPGHDIELVWQKCWLFIKCVGVLIVLSHGRFWGAE